MLRRSPEEQAAISAALVGAFDKDYREQRTRLIPRGVPELLTALAESQDAVKAVTNWLQREPPLPSVTVEPSTDEALQLAARRMVDQLGRLSSDELAALRIGHRDGPTQVAARQAAFESVWHRVSVPGATKRHALREALATVAAIYAMTPNGHLRRETRHSFEESVRQQITHERRSLDGTKRCGPLEQLLSQLYRATSMSRDGLLLRLVQRVLAEPLHGGHRTIDFADLLLDVARWDDPVHPTPARWRQWL